MADEWVSCVDPNSGKTYYYHSITKETTWEIPVPIEGSLEEFEEKDTDE